VAMSFSQAFKERWTEVIAPAIETVSHNGSPLKPVRVDARTVSDSILTEILTGIGRAQVVFGEITTLGMLEDNPVRNANGMYEVALAHAVRLPEEVVLFRSDRDNLLFDTANVRVNPYDPDHDPAAARLAVANAITSSLNEVELRRHLAVSQAAKTLDV